MSDQAAMPEWISHKRVRADRIESVKLDSAGGKIVPVAVLTAGGITVPVPPDIFARGTPKIGEDYLVQYEDGYVSWSPAAAFEGGYHAIGERASQGSASESPPGTATESRPGPIDVGIAVTRSDGAPNGEGMVTVQAIDAEGTLHKIDIGDNHGALLSLKASLSDWITKIGSRAKVWERQPKGTG